MFELRESNFLSPVFCSLVPWSQERGGGGGIVDAPVDRAFGHPTMRSDRCFASWGNDRIKMERKKLRRCRRQSKAERGKVLAGNRLFSRYLLAFTEYFRCPPSVGLPYRPLSSYLLGYFASLLAFRALASGACWLVVPALFRFLFL